MFEKEIVRLERIKAACMRCSGVGHIEKDTTKGIRLEECTCLKKIEYEIALIEANIPPKHRNFDRRNLTKKFKQRNAAALEVVWDYDAAMEKNVNNGNGLWFYSTPGLGKSSLICWLLSSAIDQGFTPYFARASHIITLKLAALKDPKAKDIIDFIVEKVDILALEELEKVYLVSEDAFIPQLFYEFLSDVYDSNTALLVSSNVEYKSVVQKFPIYIQDRLADLDLVYFAGSSERGTAKQLENDS
jgi:DNA replication protein DnaC